METEIIWSSQAIQDLEEIHSYISRDKPIAADRVVEGIYDTAQMLRRSPRIGWRYELIEDREVRILLHRPYQIAYEVQTETLVEILGIYHAARDIERLLR